MTEDTESAGDNTFIISWDMLGLEAIISTTEKEKAALFDMVKGNGNDYQKWLGHTVNMLMLRARMNPQRHYEIYVIHATGGITEENIRNLFETNPQGAADLIRERGTKLFSDRAEPGKIKIQ